MTSCEVVTRVSKLHHENPCMFTETSIPDLALLLLLLVLSRLHVSCTFHAFSYFPILVDTNFGKISGLSPTSGARHDQSMVMRTRRPA